MNKKIFIEPIGGLANRMRMIASYIEFAEKKGLDVSCVWNINNELGASFHSLFRDTDRVRFVSDKKFKLYSSNQKNLLKRWLVTFLNKCKGYHFVVKDSDVAIYGDNLEGILSKHVCMYVCTCEELKYATDFSMFKPNYDLQTIIDTYCEQFTKNTIGLHIRRTDNVLSIEKSPLSLFENAILEELSVNAETKFYVTSDDETVEKSLKERFSDKVIIREKQYGRGDEQGIKDAVIDLYLLSKTKKIYGSYWSSFSDIASRIGQIPLLVLSK